MAGTNIKVRLGKAAREFNVGINTLVDFLGKKGFHVDTNPNSRLEPEMYALLADEFQAEKKVKEMAHQKGLEYIGKKSISIEEKPEEPVIEKPEEEFASKELFIQQTNVAYSSSQENKTTVEPVEETTEAKNVDKTEPPVIKEEKPTEPEISVEKETKQPAEEKIETQKEKPPQKPPLAEEPKEKKIVDEEKTSVEEKTIHTEEKIVEKKSVKEIKEEVTPPIAIKQPEPVPESETKSEEPEPALQDTPKPAEEESNVKRPKILGTVDLDSMNLRTRPVKKSRSQRKKEAEQKRKESKKGEEQQKEKKPAHAGKTSTPVKQQPPKPHPVKEVPQPQENQQEKKTVEETENKKPDNFIPTKVEKLTGPKILDKIVLPEKQKTGKKKKKPVASSTDNKVGQHKKKKRRRIATDNKPVKTETKNVKGSRKRPSHAKKEFKKVEPTEEEIQKQIRETLARLAPSGKSKASKHRRHKRETYSHQMEEDLKKQEEDKSTLKVTEFVTANEMANLMNVNVNEVIKTCLQLGLFVSINQRLDAEAIVLVSGEYGFEVEFVDIDDHESLDIQEEEEDNPDDMIDRAPIVTVMGHVDHGKTKLLDYIRKANVVAGEAGGITQHIGAYEVETATGKKITFLDTPGHEAFTAMRARGAKVTDVAIIVIAADDSVMPQTKEAINHAQAAGVPLVFAINKIDKPAAEPEKIKEQLAGMNILVEDWGGKFQSQEISSITGQGIDELLEKVLLEAEMLELKANPNKKGKGTVLESSLDKGRGYVANILVQDGTITKGDVILAGPIYGKVKAMFNERNKPVKKAGPSVPLLLLGLTGAPQAGDVFNVMKDEKEARHLASKRQQLIREQNLRTQKHITLDEIGRRIAIGGFKELNVIVKGDVDGSIEALSDALLKLSTKEVQVNVIHKAVGAITESDILLASASDAVIIGFQVRPIPQARKLAEQEQIDIRLYSIIYQATEELKAAIEGMLEPKMEEKIICNVEVRNVFKITKVGTVAGCYVLDGKITRNTKIRLIRDGIVVYSGSLGSLKRFKDDVKEVTTGYECGLNIENFNDVKVGDIIEGYEMMEVKRK